MRLFRVLLSAVLAVAALSLLTATASAQSRLPCKPFPACFFAGGEEDDDDDDDGGDGSAAPIGDFTFGAGSAAFGAPTLSTFRFAAVSGPAGESASGFADATSIFGVRFAGPVTCLRVEGNRAAFEVDNADPTGQDAVFFVGDFGPAGMGDEFNFDPLGQADAVCESPPTQREQSVVAGDIVVGDNQPLDGGGDDDDDDD